MENFTCKYNDKYINSFFVNQAVLVPSIFKKIDNNFLYTILSLITEMTSGLELGGGLLAKYQ